MRIDSIHVQNFGHFSQLDLDFGDSPIVLLHGQNEAGKTTLLEFLRHLLFGFPERSPYNFGSGEMAGSASLTFADGRRLNLKRRKGRKNTVAASFDHDSTELDDAAFRRLLGNANENVFKSIFAFGLDELRSGNESLREESLQSALFGGGIGGAFNPDQLLKELESAAADFFRPAAIKPSINVLSREIKDLSAGLRQLQVRSDEYERRRGAWKEAQLEADRRSSELNQLRLERARLERLDRALPLWRSLRELKVQRAGVTAPAQLPADAGLQFARLVEEIGQFTSDLAVLEQELKADEGQLASLQLDKTVLPWRGEIEACQRMIQSAEDARRDLPIRRAEFERLTAELLAEVRRLRPGWELRQLRQFSLDSAQQHQLDQLYQRWEALQEQETVLKTRRQQLVETGAQQESELQALGPEEDAVAWSELLERGAEYTNEQKLLAKELTELNRLQVSRDNHLARLSPPLPRAGLEVEQVARLPVPPRELLTQYDGEFRAARQTLAAAEQSLADEQDTCDRLEQELATLADAWRKVPELSELIAARTQRDQLVTQLQALQAAEVPAAEWSAEWERLRTAIRQTDALADAIQEHASEVTRRDSLRRQVNQCRQRVQIREQQRAVQRQALAGLEQRWLALWSETGIKPLSPDLMLGWSTTFDKFVEAHSAVTQKTSESLVRRERQEQFELQLRSQEPDRSAEPAVLLRALRVRVDGINEQNALRRRLSGERQRNAKLLRDLGEQERQWQAACEAWRTPWRELLEQIGLPASWDTKLAREVLGQLAAAKERLAQLADLERRIEQMNSRLADFDPRVQRLCEQLGEPFDRQFPERHATMFQQRLADATQIQERRAQIAERIEERRRLVLEKTTRLEWGRSRQQQLLELAGVNSEAAFQPVLRAAEAAARLDADIASVAGRLAVARERESAEGFEQELATLDETWLRGRLASLDSELSANESAEKEQRELAGSLRRRFEELAGGDEAAQRQEQVARKQAQLATEIHRYVPLAFAHRLLEAAIQRFERDNQPELVRQISQLFSTMTSGRYVEIERSTNDRTALYVRRADGAERSPDQLSTATREQLYLAIRLGYVVHYCGQSEPLPIVMDDVLVNFDAHRAIATLEALRHVAARAQILFFTCHQHMQTLVQRVFPQAALISLS